MGTPTVEALLNGAALVCVVPRYPVGIADYSKSNAGMLRVIKVRVVKKILSQPLI